VTPQAGKKKPTPEGGVGEVTHQWKRGESVPFELADVEISHSLK
jgi:hypothetical protein